jgi:uncharacterized phage infection (PIP) family protein YhgE
VIIGAACAVYHAQFNKILFLFKKNIASYLQGYSKIHTVDYHIQQSDKTLQVLEKNLQLAQNRMEQQANKRCSERQF